MCYTHFLQLDILSSQLVYMFDDGADVSSTLFSSGFRVISTITTAQSWMANADKNFV